MNVLKIKDLISNIDLTVEFLDDKIIVTNNYLVNLLIKSEGNNSDGIIQYIMSKSKESLLNYVELVNVAIEILIRSQRNLQSVEIEIQNKTSYTIRSTVNNPCITQVLIIKEGGFQEGYE